MLVSKSATIERNEIRDTVALLKQSERRWIEVDLSEQRLIAWTGKPSYAVIVSSEPSTTTPRNFAIQSMHRFARMQV